MGQIIENPWGGPPLPIQPPTITMIKLVSAWKRKNFPPMERGVTTLSRLSSHILGFCCQAWYNTLLYVVWYNLSFAGDDGKLNVQLKDISLRLDYYLKKPCLLHLFLSDSNTKHLVEYLFSLLKMWNKCHAMHTLIIINHTWFEIQHNEEYFL